MDTDRDRDTWMWTWTWAGSTLYTILRHSVPFDILTFDVLSHSTFWHLTFCLIRCFFCLTICPIRCFVPFDIFYVRYFVRSTFCIIRYFVCSTFCLIRHFGIRHFVPFDVLSFDVLSIRRLLLQHFVGDPCFQLELLELCFFKQVIVREVLYLALWPPSGCLGCCPMGWQPDSPLALSLRLLASAELCSTRPASPAWSLWEPSDLSGLDPNDPLGLMWDVPWAPNRNP